MGLALGAVQFHWLQADAVHVREGKRIRRTTQEYSIVKHHATSFRQYAADELGGYGGGGEYQVQAGFGWSNGVILDFLQMYGGKLSASAAGAIKPAVNKPIIDI